MKIVRARRACARGGAGSRSFCGVATQTKAKARLKDIVVAESSLVDRPANDHPFVLTKAADGAPEAASAEAAAPATTEAKEDMAVAPDVKQQLADTLSAVIEEVNGFAQAVGEIPVAEGAPTPPVFIESLASIGGKLTALAESLRGAAAPAAPAAEMEDAAPADPSADEKLAALVERAVENALARHMKPAEAAKSEEPAEAAKEATPAPAPTTKSDSSADLSSLRDEMRQVKLLAQAALAKATLGSLAGGGQAPNAQPAATPPAESAPIAWPDDISAALPAQPAR